MISNNSTLEFLSRNFHPFNHFSEEMLIKAESSLRIFNIKAGESLSIQACSPNDTLYVTQGSANITQASDANNHTITEYNVSNRQVVHFSYDQPPVQITADVSTTICHADNALLNDFVSLQELSSISNVKSDHSFLQRLMFLKTTRVFRLLPLIVVEEAAKRCKEITVVKGQEVIRQETKGDNFYIILEGKAEVWREELEDTKPQMTALLGTGNAFGEVALITGGARNATVKMITDGRLLQLSKEDFEELVSAPALRSVTPEVAKAMMSEGAQILDVRFEEEYEEVSIAGSILMPLPELRSHIHKLDKNKEYLILCAVGARAAAATLLLRQKNINAVFIEGGIKKWPFPVSKGPNLELILFDFCPYAQRSVISLLQNYSPCKLTYLDPDNLPDWFADVSPFGNVPILRVDKKTTIFESSVINELIALISNPKMLPSDPIELSICRSWTEFGSTLLSQVTSILSVNSEEEFLDKKTELHINLQRLEDQLEGRGPYFTGNNFSLIDSTYAPLFTRMEHLNKYIPLYTVGDYPRIEKWANNLLKLASVKNSTPGNFEKIYDRFIQRRGAGGWVGEKCKPKSLH